jgi:hypothetical protein
MFATTPTCGQLDGRGNDWRRRLAEKPTLVSRRKKGLQVMRPQSPASTNRNMVVLRADLNKVIAPGVPYTRGFGSKR